MYRCPTPNAQRKLPALSSDFHISAADTEEYCDRLALAAARRRRTPPYVAVAHSLGGLYARVFNGLYRAEVAALVLIDAASEDGKGFR